MALADPKPTTLAQLQTIVNAINSFVTANAADIVISPTGKIWANKNLGASQVATFSMDADSYGNHYQWGKAQAFTSAYSTTNNIAGPVASAASAGTNFLPTLQVLSIGLLHKTIPFGIQVQKVNQQKQRKTLALQTTEYQPKPS